jgi:RNA polymerase sigma factor (sigma-70 family)
LEAIVIFSNKKKSNLVLISGGQETKPVSRPVAPDDFDFKELFRANYPTVLRHAVFLTGNRALAEDVAQETFIKLYERPPREFTNLSGWLLTVATNIAYNNLRSEKSRKRREEAEIPVDEVFDQDLEGLVDAERVRELLAKLDDRDRTCLVLKFSGFSYEEIAQIVGINKSSVGKVIARALEKFKKVYEKEMA